MPITLAGDLDATLAVSPSRLVLVLPEADVTSISGVLVLMFTGLAPFGVWSSCRLLFPSGAARSDESVRSRLVDMNCP